MKEVRLWGQTESHYLQKKVVLEILDRVVLADQHQNKMQQLEKHLILQWQKELHPLRQWLLLLLLQVLMDQCLVPLEDSEALVVLEDSEALVVLEILDLVVLEILDLVVLEILDLEILVMIPLDQVEGLLENHLVVQEILVEIHLVDLEVLVVQ